MPKTYWLMPHLMMSASPIVLGRALEIEAERARSATVASAWPDEPDDLIVTGVVTTGYDGPRGVFDRVSGSYYGDDC